MGGWKFVIGLYITWKKTKKSRMKNYKTYLQLWAYIFDLVHLRNYTLPFSATPLRLIAVTALLMSSSAVTVESTFTTSKSTGTQQNLWRAKSIKLSKSLKAQTKTCSQTWKAPGHGSEVQVLYHLQGSVSLCVGLRTSQEGAGVWKHEMIKPHIIT